MTNESFVREALIFVAGIFGGSAIFAVAIAAAIF